jgi:hypothetical protein
MFNSRTKTLRMIRIAVISLFAVIIVAYAIWRSLNYARGPVIDIFQPLNGSAVATSTVNIIGRALRVNSLTLNDKTVFIDEDGNFSETLIVFTGMNILTFDAHDQFGRETKKELELVGVF